MKSKITTSVRLSGSGQEHINNNFKRVSKTTFIYLGILITMLSNSSFAFDLTKEQNYQENISSEMILVLLSNGTEFKKPALELESESMKNWITNYKKTIEEVIAEDNKIIESDIADDLSSAYEILIKKGINEDNQIIESNITNEVFPLDFVKLNKSLFSGL